MDETSIGSNQPKPTILEGTTARGKKCRLVDNTASAAHDALQELLDELIAHNKFGPGGMSAAGENHIVIGQPESAHVQVGEHLYRLIVDGYDARLETF